MLQVAVLREGEAFRGFTTGIEGDELARDILHGLLRGRLELLPCPRSELVNLRRLAIARLVARDAVQRMDIDEEHIAIPIDQLDRLVHLAVFGDLHQAVETTYTVVDVDHIVARAQLIELRHGHLLVALDLAIDAVTAVTIEDLMVGVEADFQVVIHKSLMERGRDRTHLRLATAHLVEDILQALDLHLVLREDEGAVATLAVTNHIVGQQLEVLVEGGLRQSRELNDAARLALGQVVTQHHHTRQLQVGGQPHARGQEAIDLRRILQIGQRATTNLVHLAQNLIRIVEPPGRLAPHEVGQRHTRPATGSALQIGHNRDPFQAIRRELARNLETANRIDLIAKEINTIGLILGIGEEVHQTASHGILARLVDKIDARKARLDKRLLQHLDRDHIPHPYLQCTLFEGPLLGHPLGQCLGVGAEDAIPLAVKVREGRQGCRALHHPLRILGSIGCRTLVGGGEEVDILLIEQVVEVIHQVGRRIAVIGHKDMHPLQTRHSTRRIERKSPADQLIEMDGRALLLQTATQRGQRSGPGHQLRHLLAWCHYFLISSLSRLSW